jgi:hypothetical protein
MIEDVRHVSPYEAAILGLVPSMSFTQSGCSNTRHIAEFDDPSPRIA